MAEGFGLDATREADAMRDWAASRGEMSRSWDARYRNWLRKAVEFHGGTPPPKPSAPKVDMAKLRAHQRAKGLR
jgi:hypothetical protein